MQAFHHYETLSDNFKTTGVAHEVSVQELADLFCCTKRNVNLILAELKEEELIDWKSGRGRGNKSSIILLRDIEDIIIEKSKAFIVRNNIVEAIELVKNKIKNPSKKREVSDWLSQHFGYQQEDVDNQALDILRLSFYRPIPNLDPTYTHRRTEAHMVRQLFDTLVKYDKSSESIIPHLAHHWRVEEKGTRWTFFIRKGVRFHHGRTLTTKDVAFTFNRLEHLTAAQYHWLIKEVKEIKIVNDYIIQFTLSNPNMLFLNYLASVSLSILPKDLDALGDFSRKPIGTGPFKIKQNNDQRLILEAHDEYFLGRSHLDLIDFWIIPNLIEKMEVDLGNTSAINLAKINKGFKYHTLNQLEKGSSYLMFNLNKSGPQNNSLFRQAIHYAINRNKMIEELGGNRQVPSTSFLPENEGASSNKTNNIKVARDLLSQLGPIKQSIKIYTYHLQTNEENIKWIQKCLHSLGIELEIKVLKIEELILNRRFMEADIVLSGEVLDEDLELSLIDIYQTNSSIVRNFLNKSMQKNIENMLVQVYRAKSKTDRLKKLTKIETYLKEEFAILFLYHTKQHLSYRTQLNGITMNAFGLVNYKDLWFDPLENPIAEITKDKT